MRMMKEEEEDMDEEEEDEDKEEEDIMWRMRMDEEDG